MTVERMLALDAELRAVHVRLRDALDVAREAVEAGASNESLARDIRLFCHGFCVALGGHHRGEDRMLFAEILGANPELGDVVADLERDHRVLDQLIGSLENAVMGGEDTATLTRHLDGIDAIMETHLGYEERQLLPALAGVQVPATDIRRWLGPLAG